MCLCILNCNTFVVIARNRTLKCLIPCVEQDPSTEANILQKLRNSPHVIEYGVLSQNSQRPSNCFYSNLDENSPCPYSST
jgi:hypothetical protein